MNDSSHAPADVPQLRTLLLTDLCDSTRIVEKLGDTRAAELFREHDRLVLRLQQRWRGRLIDRSDGLLLLFERPIDGLGFALDYERGLCELGTERQVVLTARAGLHVGEVLTWRNSDEAVRVGSKPLEVEGIAKPFAARLMSMARPGQILLSAVAEPLAYRAARELGDRADRLVWKPHGRGVFKGMPGTQEIFEVGEPGIAPLRAPPNTAKTWRAIPLWRRPRMLVAEVALLACIAAGAWFALRPQPAIAFGERDWVVVGDLRNLTGQKVLDDSLEQAFRISLEQSRYVNVLSDLKARDTLTRMRRGPDTALDRETASEIALRDGARAVILPTVAEVGGRLRVSVELVDPHTQTTVYAESVDGSGIDSVLGSIDAVTASVREKLGETLRSIERDSAPLPDVTTTNLDALRAYALGQAAYAKGVRSEALRFFERATSLDPEFALAWIGQVRAHVASVDAPSAVPAMRQARLLRQRLPQREAMYVDAWTAEFDAPAKAPALWRELAALYPDFWAASANAATGLFLQNRFREAATFAEHGLEPQNPSIALAYDLVGRARLGMGEYAAAATAFDRALAKGNSESLRRRAAVEASKRDFQAAERLIGDEPAASRYTYLEKLSIAIDRAQATDARAGAGALLRFADAEDGFDGRAFLLNAAIAAGLFDDRSQALRLARTAGERALAKLRHPDDADATNDALLALSAALFMQRMGDGGLVPATRAVLRRRKDLTAVPAVAELSAVLDAERLRLKGRSGEAIRLLAPLVDGSERYQTRVALAEAYAASGKHALALKQTRWLANNRGLAYIEQGCGQCMQPLNVADSNLAILRSAELLIRLGQPHEARKMLQEFDRRWPIENLPAYLRTRRDRTSVASS
jgi:putative peptide modification system cyclase